MYDSSQVLCLLLGEVRQSQQGGFRGPEPLVMQPYPVSGGLVSVSIAFKKILSLYINLSRNVRQKKTDISKK